jgi:hypothetical protein
MWTLYGALKLTSILTKYTPFNLCSVGQIKNDRKLYRNEKAKINLFQIPNQYKMLMIIISNTKTSRVDYHTHSW